MTNRPEYWTEVEALFADAVDLEPGARRTLLSDRAGGRPELRAEVESLLDAHARAERFVRPAPAGAAAAEYPPIGDPRIGSQIGPFRLVDAIGAGGMGTVYRAERADGGFEQQVAIKVIAASLAHASTARRFRAERQILASLRHPHIVTLLDGGVTPEGQAYLVMEYVEGTPISTYCREHGLTLEARLRLFRQVCSAVHYAHRHFVVHRDLKPDNILITAEGVPKVLDFGVAKLLEDPETDAAATVTAPGAGPLTPNYASPEQFRGLPVTTSSDVYALGVLLYEVVAGERPYETAGKPLDEVMRLVVDTEPPRPSATAATPFPYDRRRALKGDIDTIVARAMSKEPERRYGSADELGDDVGRYLEGKPIQARDPSMAYVIRKLASTHRAIFISAGVSAVLIVAALVVAVWQARVATGERRRAERRFNDVRALANTLIFDIHDAVAPLPGSTPVRKTIVAEALRYLERLAPEAQGDVSLQGELARAYTQIGKVQGAVGSANLGDRAGALSSFTKARAILEPLATAPGAPVETVADYLEAMGHLSGMLNVIPGRRQEARTAALEAVRVADDLQRRMPSDAKARNLVARSNFAAAIATEGQASLDHWNRAGALYDAMLAESPDDPARQRNVALVEKYVGSYYLDSGEYVKALAHHQRARALDEKRLARAPADRQTQLDVAFDLGNVAHVSVRQGNLTQGAEFYERSLAIRQALAESDPRDELARSRVGFAHVQLAAIYRQLRDSPRAYEHSRTAVALFEPTHRTDVLSRHEFASALRELGRSASDLGRRAEACAAFAKAFDAMRNLDVKDRAEGVDLKNDPLPKIAAEAAACGDRSAQDWVARHAP